MPRKPAFQLDELDRKLLDLLQTDAARPLYELGDLVGLSPSAVQRRLSRYRASGVIARQIAVLDPDVVAGTVLACVLVTLERETKKLHSVFRQRLLAAAEVQQCYGLGGCLGLPGDCRRQQHAAMSHGYRRAPAGRAEREALRDVVHLRTHQARPEHSAASHQRQPLFPLDYVLPTQPIVFRPIDE